MIEFGEQLRKARVEKGMTQHTLSGKLFVTGRDVSRWECGDRFPDLITTKKISEILNVSIDDLLSGENMDTIVKRNPIIENKSVNALMILSYVVMLISLLLHAINRNCISESWGALIDNISHKEFYFYIWELNGFLIMLVDTMIFVYGLIQAANGMLSSERVGLIVTVYSVAGALGDLPLKLVTWRPEAVISLIMYNIPIAIGGVAAYFYFIHKDNRKIWPGLLLMTSVWNIYMSVDAIVLGMVDVFDPAAVLWRDSNLATTSLVYYQVVKSIPVILIYGMTFLHVIELYRKRKIAGEAVFD